MCDMAAPVHAATPQLAHYAGSGSADYNKAWTAKHPTNPTSTSHGSCHHQKSTSGGHWQWRRGDGTEHHQGDQGRCTPTSPGRGRGSSRGSPVDATGGDWPFTGVAKGVASAKDEGANQTGHQGDGLLADDNCETAKKIQGQDDRASELQTEVVERHLNPVPVKNILKIVSHAGRLQKHSSSSMNLSDSGNCCSCKSELKELYQENGNLRLRVKAIETITDILEKSKKELETEKNRNSKLDIAVRNLQSRLYQVGCDTSVDLAENEIFIPGHDRAFVNSLISENGKLLKELKELKKSGDIGTKVESEVVECLKNQLLEANEQLSASLTKTKELETLLQSSDDDAKTAKIVHLEDACQRRNKDLQECSEMCRVLNAETKRLQEDLSASQNQLGKVSQELNTWKEKAQNLESKVLDVSMQKMAVQKESNLSLADRLKIAEGQVEQLDKENSRLTDQLREVIGMNTRWQRYNEQREVHVLKLTKTNQHQQSKITVLEQQKRDLEQSINGLNVMLQKLKDEQRKNTDAAILALEHQVAQREDRISELVEELSALKMYIQGGENESGLPQRAEDKERIQLLEQQAKTYKDDFEQERRDRERLQSNVDILRHRLHSTSRKLAALEQENTYTTPNVGLKTGSAPVYQPPRGLVARGIARPRYTSDEDTYLTSNVEIDGQDEPDGQGSNTEPLQCPRCAQEFSVANHSSFMTHVGICLDQ